MDLTPFPSPAGEGTSTVWVAHIVYDWNIDIQKGIKINASVKGIPGPYRFYFYSFDCNEPIHVHVQREKMICKFWLDPTTLSQNHGFRHQN